MKLELPSKKRVKELQEKNRTLADEHEELQLEVVRLRRAVEGVRSICMMDKSIKQSSNPEAILFLIKRELEN